MKINELGLDGVVEVIPKKFGDDRGFFSEVYNHAAFQKHGINIDWIQDNQSLSAEVGVLRGLHFQKPPFAQDKLVRVIRGRIFDVAVDIRDGSPTFGKWVGIELSTEKWNQILVPKGFAHGFLTLEPNCEVAYKVSNSYSPDHDRSIRFDDPDIGIEWPELNVPFQLSDKDKNAHALATVDVGFKYGE